MFWTRLGQLWGQPGALAGTYWAVLEQGLEFRRPSWTQNIDRLGEMIIGGEWQKMGTRGRRRDNVLKDEMRAAWTGVSASARWAGAEGIESDNDYSHTDEGLEPPFGSEFDDPSNPGDAFSSTSLGPSSPSSQMFEAAGISGQDQIETLPAQDSSRGGLVPIILCLLIIPRRRPFG